MFSAFRCYTYYYFSVWAREEAIYQTWYAVEAGPEILTWYEEFFDVTFPLPKQDMIALPDFSIGAMENWGLITYRFRLNPLKLLSEIVTCIKL